MLHHLLALDKYITLKLTIFLFPLVSFNSPIVSCDSQEVHCDPSLRKIIVSDETRDIEAPAEIGTRGWGGRGLALSLSAVAMDRSELPRAMPTGAIERFIVSCANPQQANSQQSISPEWVILIHCFCFPTRIFKALSCILAWFFVVISVFFFMKKTPSTVRAQLIG
jgi:hypothetical protein